MSKRYSTVRHNSFDIDKRENGTYEITLRLTVVDPKESGHEVGDTIFHRCYLTDNPKTGEWAVKTLRNLGMTNDNPLEPEGLGSILAECVEEEETWEGKTKFKSKYINQFGSKSKKATLDPMDLDDFKERMAGFFMDAPAVEVTDENKVTDSDNF